MSRIATLLSVHARGAWAAIWLSAALVAVSIWLVDTGWRSQQRQSLLEAEAHRSAIEIMSATLNGNLMGALTLLGIMDPDIKQDATNGLLSVDASIDSKLGMLGGAFGARGVFVLSSDGIIKTSWSSAGKSMGGQDVRFRPYYQAAMQGKSSVHAAIGSGSGERTLYFSAPVYAEAARAISGVGAVVAQAKADGLDDLLRRKADIALLLSPHGVVFAASHDEWVGLLEGQPSVQRIRAIRDFRQFGAWFDKADPKPLPLNAVDGLPHLEAGRFAVATANVDWNDPSGPWKLVLLEDLSHTVTARSAVLRALAATLVYGLLAWMVMHLSKGRHRQNIAAMQLQLLATDQERQLLLRTQLAAAMLRLQQCNDMPSLARTFLSDVHAMFGVLQGVVYARSHEAENRFALQASFACANELAATLRAGEGLLGQCAIERQPQVLAVGDGGLVTLRSGLGSTQPQCTVMLPLIRSDDVLGLVEVVSLSAPADFQLGAFSEFAHALALNLEILQRAEQTGLVLAQAEAVRQSSAAQMQWQQTLIDAIPCPVFYKDAATCFRGVNRAYEEVFAVSKTDLIGKTGMALGHLFPGDRRVCETEDQHVLQTGAQVRKVTGMVLADGKVHRILSVVARFTNPDGSPGGLVGTCIDLEVVDCLDHTGTERLPQGENA